MGDDNYKYFVDKQSLMRDLVAEADYGVINGYSESYGEVTVNDSYFIVMRID